MRFIIPMLVLAGCTNDFVLHTESTNADSATFITEPTDETFPLPQPEDCWFQRWNGERIDTDGDGLTDELPEVWVKSLAQFETEHPTHELVVGNGIEFEVTASSLRGCGDLQLKSLYFEVEDLEVNGPAEWMDEVGDLNLPGYLSANNGEVFNDTSFTYWDPGTASMSYIWADSAPVSMRTQEVTADDSVEYHFRWNGSVLAPIGTQFYIGLWAADWVDVESGELITQDYAPWIDPSTPSKMLVTVVP